jgi:hypothetical protein
MLAMRLCGNGDCAIPIGPTHSPALYPLRGRRRAGGCLAGSNLAYARGPASVAAKNGNGQFGDCKSVEAFYRSKLRNGVGSLAQAISSFAIAPPDQGRRETGLRGK